MSRVVMKSLDEFAFGEEAKAVARKAAQDLRATDTGDESLAAYAADRPVRLYAYPGEATTDLGPVRDVARFARWLQTQDDEVLKSFGQHGWTNPQGGVEDVAAFRGKLAEALSRVEKGEGIGQQIHAIGDKVLAACADGIEGIAISEGEGA